jgi:hypothetical protein
LRGGRRTTLAWLVWRGPTRRKRLSVAWRTGKSRAICEAACRTLEAQDVPNLYEIACRPVAILGIQPVNLPHTFRNQGGNGLGFNRSIDVLEHRIYNPVHRRSAERLVFRRSCAGVAQRREVIRAKLLLSLQLFKNGALLVRELDRLGRRGGKEREDLRNAQRHEADEYDGQNGRGNNDRQAHMLKLSRSISCG